MILICPVRYKSKYSHVNFLASPRGSHSSDTVIPTLFFAECCNDNDITDEPLCWPIMGHPGMLSSLYMHISTTLDHGARSMPVAAVALHIQHVAMVCVTI
mgnify:CR=1 FL=1